jgi:hypothetical protein
VIRYDLHPSVCIISPRQASGIENTQSIEHISDEIINLGDPTHFRLTCIYSDGDVNVAVEWKKQIRFTFDTSSLCAHRTLF